MRETDPFFHFQKVDFPASILACVHYTGEVAGIVVDIDPEDRPEIIPNYFEKYAGKYLCPRRS